MERLLGLCYMLRMMDIPIAGPTYMYDDNMSFIYNTYRPESTLNKKFNSICYHIMCEAVVMVEVLTTNVKSEKNPSDIFT